MAPAPGFKRQYRESRVAATECHGDFLNADHEYRHENKSIKGFGSYGDLLIRDRKMYVVPTPFRLVDGLAHQQTLILPKDNVRLKGSSQEPAIMRRETTEPADMETDAEDDA